MEAVILVIHLMLALAIIGLVLLQRSEGGGLGIGGGGGMGALASPHSTANMLTRATAICAACFFVTSLVLGILSGAHSQSKSLLDNLDSQAVPAGVVQTIGEDAVVPVPEAEPETEPAPPSVPVE